MSKFKCKICGKEFDRVGNAIYCKGPHYRPCPVCGKPVEFKVPSDPVRCCSKECANILSNKSKSSKTKICKECGKEFHPKQASQVYCEGPHTSICVVCGKEFEYSVRPSEKPKTCSKECQSKLRKLTNMKKYGVDNVSKLDDIKKKISDINSSEEVKQKRKQTSLLNWGVDNPAKNKEIAKKMSEKMSSREYLDRREKTCIERYGFSSPMMSEEVKAKQARTNIERYGSKGHPHSKEDIMRMMIDPSKIDNYISFKEDPSSFISSNYREKPAISKLQSDLGVTNTPIYNILIEHGCSDLLQRSYSCIEDEVVDFLMSISPDLNIIRNDRTVIKPSEIDIYLPDYKIGIECNPVSTHNSSFVDPWGSDPKHYKYHQNKSIVAERNGVFLFHVFGYEWSSNKDIIKSMIRNLLGLNEKKIGARETILDKNVSYNEFCNFLNENHRQGSISAKVRLGLRDNDGQLVSVMSFGHMRNTMGYSKGDKGSWELSRFCNKINTSVIGSASKLFKYFLGIYNPDKVISFSDVAHTRGDLYELLGFKYDHLTTPSYVWVDKYDSISYHRVNCQKKYLPKLLKDDSVDMNKTEKEIMEEHGFARVYDCGVIKWVYQPFIR